jgi:hypothetical protein
MSYLKSELGGVLVACSEKKELSIIIELLKE